MTFSWFEQKQKARDIVHKTMGVTGLYSDDRECNVPVTIRYHRKSAYIGDDFSEFSPGHFSEINRVVIDLREVTPKRGGTVFIESMMITLKIENFTRQGDHYVLCEVFT